MTKDWRQIASRLEAESIAIEKRKEKHPAIANLSVGQADKNRRLHFVGQKAVTCDLPCFGPHIPFLYNHRGNTVNVFRLKICVQGYENPPVGKPCYTGNLCNLTSGRVCVARDSILFKAAKDSPKSSQ